MCVCAEGAEIVLPILTEKSEIERKKETKKSCLGVLGGRGGGVGRMGVKLNSEISSEGPGGEGGGGVGKECTENKL